MNTCAIPGLNLRIPPNQLPLPNHDVPLSLDGGMAILAGGCFWCTEAVFRQLDGVLRVEPGYCGGSAEQANYQAVCTGLSGHAEVIRIHYQAERISFGKLLQIFFALAHDATQINRQGNDIGHQYRSALFPVDVPQAQMAQAYIQQLNDAQVFFAPIATTIEPGQIFYSAETYHHNYAQHNPQQAYIQAVSQPKLEKLQKFFHQELKQ